MRDAEHVEQRSADRERPLDAPQAEEQARLPDVGIGFRHHDDPVGRASADLTASARMCRTGGSASGGTSTSPGGGGRRTIARPLADRPDHDDGDDDQG